MFVFLNYLLPTSSNDFFNAIHTVYTRTTSIQQNVQTKTPNNRRSDTHRTRCRIRHRIPPACSRGFRTTRAGGGGGARANTALLGLITCHYRAQHPIAIS